MMPSKTLNLDVSQLSYLETYAEEHGISESQAARELLNKGIEVDKDE